MTESISAKLLLALAVKLKTIFEQEDRFLSFPLSLGFSNRYLEFMRDPTQTSLSAQEQVNYKGDFARLMNIIPEDRSIFSQDASQFLWDRLKQTLKSCVFPLSGLTPAEELQLNQAQDFLTDEEISIDGMKVPVNSKEVYKYYQCKTLYEAAERTYLEEKLTVELTTGIEAEKLKQQWSLYREKELLEFKNKAEQDWINLGFKRQVEYYQSIKNQLEIRKYLNLYGSSCMNELEIAEINDINGNGTGFYTTFFSPSNAFDPNLPWTKLSLTRQEIDALINAAPAELKAIFQPDQEGGEIDSITLEYNNVVLIRPWLKQEFFQSRYWRLPDTTLVSDGKIPRQGLIPAYITSLLVARNVEIRRKKPPGSAESTSTTPPVVVKPAQVFEWSNQIADINAVKQSLVAQSLKPRPANLATVAVRPQPMPMMRAATLSTASTLDRSVTGAYQPKTSFIQAANQPGLTVQAAVVNQGAVVNQNILLQQRLNKQKFYAATKYQGLTVEALYQEPPAKPQPETNPQIVTEKISVEGVVVLAMICKRVPKSPDPDPALQW